MKKIILPIVFIISLSAQAQLGGVLKGKKKEVTI